MHSIKFKRNVISEIRQTKNIMGIAKKYNLTVSILQDWLDDVMVNSKSKYSNDVKEKIIKELKDGKTPGILADKYNVPVSTVHTWYKRNVFLDRYQKFEQKNKANFIVNPAVAPVIAPAISSPVEKIMTADKEEINKMMSEIDLVKQNLSVSEYKVPLNKNLENFCEFLAKKKNVSISQLIIDIIVEKHAQHLFQQDENYYKISFNKDVKDFWVAIAKKKDTTVPQLIVETFSKKAQEILTPLNKELDEIREKRFLEADLDL